MKLIETKNFTVAVNEYGNSTAQKLCILLPGRLDTKDYINFVSHGEYLSARGFFVVAIDPPGTWESPGDIANYTTTLYVQAVNEVIDFYGNRPTTLLGHSRGGAVAMVASANKVVEAIVVINAAYDAPSAANPAKIVNGALPEFRDLPPGNVRTEEKRQFNLPLAYFEDGARYIPANAIRAFQGAKLVVHAEEDEFKPLEEVKKIYEELEEPKMFLQVSGTHDYRLFLAVIEQVNEALGKFLS